MRSLASIIFWMFILSLSKLCFGEGPLGPKMYHGPNPSHEEPHTSDPNEPKINWGPPPTKKYENQNGWTDQQLVNAYNDQKFAFIKKSLENKTCRIVDIKHPSKTYPADPNSFTCHNNGEIDSRTICYGDGPLTTPAWTERTLRCRGFYPDDPPVPLRSAIKLFLDARGNRVGCSMKIGSVGELCELYLK